jgi:hypothetical protein
MLGATAPQQRQTGVVTHTRVLAVFSRHDPRQFQGHPEACAAEMRMSTFEARLLTLLRLRRISSPR